MVYKVSLIDSDTNGRRRLYEGEDGEIWYTDDTLTLAHVDAAGYSLGPIIFPGLKTLDEMDELHIQPEESDETLGGRVNNKETDIIYH